MLGSFGVGVFRIRRKKMAAKNTRPFTVKGINVTSPKGKALWCKIHEPDRTFNAKGELSTSLVCNPKGEGVQEFIKTLEGLRDQAFAETKESLGEVKAKAVNQRAVYSEDTDKDGNPTGNILFKFKLNNIDDRKAEGRQYEIPVVDAAKKVVENVPIIGNGSVIRVAGFANPYFMANTKEVGVSIIFNRLQLIDLVSYGGGDEFGVEDGYISSASDDEIMQDAPF